jgi:hypothetical protein
MLSYSPIVDKVQAAHVPDKGDDKALRTFLSDVLNEGATGVEVRPEGVYVKLGEGRARTYSFGSWIVFGSNGATQMSDEDFTSKYRADHFTNEEASTDDEAAMLEGFAGKGKGSD